MLTTRGISVQALASIAAYRLPPEYCTINDCQTVLDRLLRKFSEPLTRNGGQQHYHSVKVLDDDGYLRSQSYRGEFINDHVIPIIEITRQLLALPNIEINEENIQVIDSMLRSQLIICKITDSENAELTKKGLAQTMSSGWRTPGHRDNTELWCRYMHAEIYEFIRPGKAPVRRV